MLAILPAVLPVMGFASPADAALTVSTGPAVAALSAADGTPVPSPAGELAAAVLRGVVEPHERYAEILVRSPWPELDNVMLAAAAFDVASGALLTETAWEALDDAALISVDMRRLEPDVLRVRLTARSSSGQRATAEAVVQRSAITATPLPETIPVLIDRPPVGDAPPPARAVTFGVPFPAGALWSLDGLHVVDDRGLSVAAQLEPVAHWARGGSIRWIRVDAAVPDVGNLALRFDGDVKEPTKPLAIECGSDGIVTVRAGDWVYRLGPGASPILSIARKGEVLAETGAARGLYVVDAAGRTASACAQETEILVETVGPQHACILIEGPYRTPEGEILARHSTRVEFQAGIPHAEITHTLILTRDTRETWFSDIGWELQVNAGTEPTAHFALAPALESPRRRDVPLASGRAAFVFQQDYLTFGQGEPVFQFGRQAADGTTKNLETGAAMGDWAALTGSAGGLAWICKDTARQHPKEFLVSDQKLTLRLFSPRGGDELDFRAATLVEKWRLDDWFPAVQRERYREAHGRDALETVAAHESNAAGWAKTHTLRLVALQPGDSPDILDCMARELHAPAFAAVDPAWMYATRVLGPLWPYDPERFERAEQYIEEVFSRMYDRVRGAFNGFVDYWAGPTYNMDPTRGTRYGLTYGIRPSLWLVYARSGSRDARTFAQATNRAFLDNYMAHWDTETKTRGLYNAFRGGPFNTSMLDLPFYWGQITRSNISSSTNLDQFLWDYYLTGYRRARDAVLQYGAGVKSIWEGEASLRSPGFTTQRPLATLGALAQTYAVDWDPEMRAILSETVDFLYDPEELLAVTKRFRAGGSAIYKTRADVRGVIAAARIAPGPRTAEIARRTARYQWDTFLGGSPAVRYMQPLGVAIDYLAEGAPAPRHRAAADWYVRTLAARYDPDTGTALGGGASAISAIFEALPYLLSVVASGPDDEDVSPPWIDLSETEEPGLLVARKAAYDRTTLYVRSPTPDAHGRTSAGARLSVAALDNRGEGLSITDSSGPNAGFGSVTRVELTAAARAGDYMVLPAAAGPLFALADREAPLVLVQPGFWSMRVTYPEQRVYFELPEQELPVWLYLEHPGSVYTPEGSLWEVPQAPGGWIELPADQPGIWSFKSASGRVSLRGAPPVFAFGHPERLFTPDTGALASMLPERTFAAERFNPLLQALEPMEPAPYPADEDLQAWVRVLQDDPDLFRRHHALEHLLRQPAPEAPADFLAVAVEDPHWSLRAPAVKQLAARAGKQALERLLMIMANDPDAAVRDVAKDALLSFGHGATSELIVLLRQHDDWQVQSRAAVLLGAIGDERALPALIDTLRDFDDWRVRNRAVESLRALTGTDFSGEMARDPERWEAWLQSAEEED